MSYDNSESEEDESGCLTSEICSELETGMSGRCDELIQAMAYLSDKFAMAIQNSGYQKLKEIYDSYFYGDFYGYGIFVTGYAQYNPEDTDLASGLEEMLNAQLDGVFWVAVYRNVDADFEHPIISVDDVLNLSEQVRLSERTVYDCVFYPLVSEGSNAAEFVEPAMEAMNTLWQAFSDSFMKMREELWEIERVIQDTMRLLQSGTRIGSVLSDSNVKWNM